jgi:hypothetical protein
LKSTKQINNNKNNNNIMRSSTVVTLLFVTVTFALLVSNVLSIPLRHRVVRTSQGIRKLENTCGTFTCGSKDECCSNNVVGKYTDVCYNPSLTVCTESEGQEGKNCLCATGTKCCGGSCYDPKLYKCVGGHLAQNGATEPPAPPVDVSEPVPEESYVEESYVEESYAEESYVDGSYAEGSYVDGSYAEESNVDGSFAEESYVEGSHSTGGSQFVDESFAEESFEEFPIESI